MNAKIIPWQDEKRFDGSLRDAIVNTKGRLTMSTVGMTRSLVVWTISVKKCLLRWFSLSVSGHTKPYVCWALFMCLKILTLTDDGWLFVTATILATILSQSLSNGKVLVLLLIRRANVPGRRSALSACEEQQGTPSPTTGST
jgi:hypothetical protein